MTVRLPSKMTGPLTVVVERDGERVALRMDCESAMDKRYWSGRDVLCFPGMWHADGGDHDLPVLDHWPTDGVPLPDVADGPLLVCYADGATRRVARAESDIGDGCWYTEGRGVSFDEGHSFALDDDGVALDAPSPVLAWARIRGDRLDRPEMHPGDDPIESLAKEWRVSVDDVRKAMEVERG